MLTIGTGLFIQVPDETDQRILHPAKVTAVDGTLVTAQLEDEDVPVEPGQNVFIYYEFRREFMQQSARIDAVSDVETAAVVGLETTGDAVSSESRQCHRVSTVTANLSASLGAEDACELTDVSATGFSVIAGEEHRRGTTLTATIRFEGRTYSGIGCIQSVKTLGPGRIRYGLHVGESDERSETLAQGLRAVSTSVQRKQLRRMAGAG
jgi:hypothetical protein